MSRDDGGGADPDADQVLEIERTRGGGLLPVQVEGERGRDDRVADRAELLGLGVGVSPVPLRVLGDGEKKMPAALSVRPSAVSSTPATSMIQLSGRVPRPDLGGAVEPGFGSEWDGAGCGAPIAVPQE